MTDMFVKNSSSAHAAHALLSIAQMRAAEERVISGIGGDQIESYALMANAGAAVAAAVVELAPFGGIVLLCGPGANGGDGYVAARVLKQQGREALCVSLTDPSALEGDAKRAYEDWDGATALVSEETVWRAAIEQCACVVDALFGAGLTRAIEGEARILLEACEGKRILAVDTPSGVHGDSGDILGYAPKADVTVTFFKSKPGHHLLPGRVHCGALQVADIGVPDDVLKEISPKQWLNDPAFWQSYFRKPTPFDHKYSRGMPIIVGGAALTGAARLAAKAAQRSGVGAVAVAAPVDAQTVYKVTLESALVQPFRDTSVLQQLVEDRKVSSILIGPGLGLVGATRERADMMLRTGKPVVVDADAISVFEGVSERLFDAVQGDVVLTPHEGEFKRIFPDLARKNIGNADRLARVREAAARSGCIILLKGFDTVIAAPDGRAIINTNAPPELATAGAGDVLGGLIAGLLAQGAPAFEAAAAGAWLHAEAAQGVGIGLIAEDLVNRIPNVLARF